MNTAAKNAASIALLAMPCSRHKLYRIGLHFLNDRLAASLGVTARAQDANKTTSSRQKSNLGFMGCNLGIKVTPAA
jgi:hypothetical protein